MEEILQEGLLKVLNALAEDLLLPALLLGIGLVGEWVRQKIRELKEGIKSSVDSDFHWALVAGAEGAVRFVEQVYENEDGPNKYTMAFDSLSRYLESRGFSADPEVLKMAIEQAVFELKQEVLKK
jgi:hypothetical protein